MILDSLHSYRLRAFPNLGAPVLAVPTVVGPGATSNTYVATIVTINGETIQSEPRVVANCPDVPSESYYTQLSLAAVPAAAWSINFYKWDVDTYYLLGSCTAATNMLRDIGQELDDEVSPPVTDTSGRDEWKFVGIIPGRLGQRIEMIDLQGIFFKGLKDLGDSIHNNGDLIGDGCKFTQAVGGSVTASLIGPYNVNNKTMKIGFQGEKNYEFTLTGTSVTAAALGVQIETVVNEEVDQIECSSVNNGYLKIEAKNGRTLVLYELADSVYETLGITPAIFPPLTWDVTAGSVYVDGLIVDVPAGQVTVTGVGVENVGISIDFDTITYTDDPKLRNIDDDIPVELETYNLPGADRIVLTTSWCVDTDGMIVVKKFENGKPMTQAESTIHSDVDEKIAKITYDVSGSFVVDNFKIVIDDHSTDATKLVLQMGPGKAYPGGYPRKIDQTKTYVVDKARDVTFVENGIVSSYSSPGGYVLGTEIETFNVDGLKVKFQIDSGDTHEFALTGTTESAEDVAGQINAVMNAIPTSSDLVDCSAADGYLLIQAEDGKTLHVLTPSSDSAYTELGIATGTYYPIGTRIYELNNNYVRDISDINYITEIVSSLSHDSGGKKDLLPNSEVSDILGASDTLAKAHDEVWDYVEGVDFFKDGDYINFNGMGGGEPSGTYFVKYRYNKTPTKGVRQLCEVRNAQITRGAGDTDDITFTVSDPNFIKRLSDNVTMTPSGAPKDLTVVVSVSSSPDGGGTLYSEYTFYPNSDALIHNTAYLSWAGASVKPAFEDVYYIRYKFWYHAIEGDYVAADSYDTYSAIGLAPDGDINLRDCIDFRTVDGARPIPSEAANLEYSYYLPRRDKVILAESGMFVVARGEPSRRAIPPNDIEKQLTLAVLYYPPYTYSKTDVQIISVEPVRITQSGMRNMEKRIERLEYWNAINGLEKEANTRTITYDSKGLFTDALTGWDKQDLSFSKGGITNNVALDRHLRMLMLPPDPLHDKEFVLEVDLDTPGVTDGVIQTPDGLILDYDPEPFDQQLQASMWMNCAPDYELTNYYGSMEVYPTTALFLDKEQLPALKADFENNLTAALTDITANMHHPINWSEWRDDTVITETITAANMYVTTTTSTREGLQNQLSILPGAKTVNLGDRVVDMSLTPMVQTKNTDGSPFVVQLDMKNLLPNQDHTCTVAGKPVSLVYDDSPQSGVAFGSVGTNTYNGLTTAKVDNDGRLTAKFEMPTGIEAGAFPITVFYYANRSISSATSSMFSSGFVQKNQGTVLGYESPQVTITPQIFNEEREEVDIGWYASPGAGDPIAQSFLIKNDGIYVSAVGLYFKEKHSTLGITCYIKDMVNGKPGNHIYATKYLGPGDINTHPLGEDETVFTFPEVLYYQPGQQFCFVVKPELNNTDYKIMCAEKSQIDLVTGTRIVQPHDGVMFHSPDLISWQEMTTRDLKFKLYKSNFTDQAAIQWKEITGVQASRFITKVDEVAMGDTRIKWYYTTNFNYVTPANTVWESYLPKIDVDLEAITQKITLRADVTTLGGSYQIAGRVGIKLRLHNTSANYVSYPQFFSDPLNLPNTIFAFADIDAASVNGSGETDVTAYYSVDDGLTWTELPKKSGYTPVATTDPFYRYEWELASPITAFDQFRGRLEFTTTNASKTPRVWNGVSFICSKE